MTSNKYFEGIVTSDPIVDSSGWGFHVKIKENNIQAFSINRMLYDISCIRMDDRVIIHGQLNNTMPVKIIFNDIKVVYDKETNETYEKYLKIKNKWDLKEEGDHKLFPLKNIPLKIQSIAMLIPESSLLREEFIKILKINKFKGKVLFYVYKSSANKEHMIEDICRGIKYIQANQFDVLILSNICTHYKRQFAFSSQKIISEIKHYQGYKISSVSDDEDKMLVSYLADSWIPNPVTALGTIVKKSNRLINLLEDRLPLIKKNIESKIIEELEHWKDTKEMMMLNAPSNIIKYLNNKMNEFKIHMAHQIQKKINELNNKRNMLISPFNAMIIDRKSDKIVNVFEKDKSYLMITSDGTYYIVQKINKSVHNSTLIKQSVNEETGVSPSDSNSIFHSCVEQEIGK